MVTSYCEIPFIFLNTSSALTPTGRNVRAQTRSESVQRSHPAAECRGSFGSFHLKRTFHQRVDDEPCQKRPRYKHDDDSRKSKSSTAIANTSLPPLRILSVSFSPMNSMIPPNVNFEDVLKVAAFHIRRRAALMIHVDPDKTLDALRCRQWCSVSATYVSLGRSPYLDSAITCVVSRVQEVVSGSCSDRGTLVCYSEALHLLRNAVLDPSLQDRLDMLAATQLLAIYEMLDFPENGSWMQHVSGAAAMAKIHQSRGFTKADEAGQAAPMFVEALLSNDESFFESKLWKSLLHLFIAKQFPTVQAADDMVQCFMSLRPMFAEAYRTIANMGESDWVTRMPLLMQAHDLRQRLKSLILQSEPRYLQGRKSAKDVDVLGLSLVSVMMLDRLIIALRRKQTKRHHHLDLEGDTQGLCIRMIGREMDAAEAHPGKDLLNAFQRQVNYPILTYNT